MLKQTLILTAVFAAMAGAVHFLVPALVQTQSAGNSDHGFLPLAAIGIATLGLGAMKLGKREVSAATQTAE